MLGNELMMIGLMSCVHCPHHVHCCALRCVAAVSLTSADHRNSSLIDRLTERLTHGCINTDTDTSPSRAIRPIGRRWSPFH